MMIADSGLLFWATLYTVLQTIHLLVLDSSGKTAQICYSYVTVGQVFLANYFTFHGHCLLFALLFSVSDITSTLTQNCQ